MKKLFQYFLILILVLPLFLNSLLVHAQSEQNFENAIEFSQLEVLSLTEQSLQTELTFEYSTAANEELVLNVSSNLQVPAGDYPIIDVTIGNILGEFRAQGQQLFLTFNSPDNSKLARLSLNGEYQPNSGNITITSSTDSIEGIIENQPAPVDELEVTEETSEAINNLETDDSAPIATEVLPEEVPQETEINQEFSLENLEFSAEIVETDITDGTENFDEDDTAGNDSGNNNGIIRSFDTITYPVKITLNDVAGGTIHNIKVKISGSLPDGYVAGRANAVFGENSQEDALNNRITFETEYTIPSTANAVTYPINLNVLGADNDLIIKPEFSVQLLSIDGVDISGQNIRQDFDTILPRTVSSQVSIEPKISVGTPKFASQTILTTAAYQTNDRTVPIGIELMAVPLPGKNDIKGAAFPSGKLNVNLSMDGRVVWDDGPTTNLDFTNKNRPPYIIDFHNYVVNSGATNLISSNPNTLSNTQNLSYNQKEFNDSRNYWAGSRMTDKNTYNALNSIWDSGTYQLNNFDLTTPVTFEIQDYQIGATYPIRRADGYTGRTIYTGNQKAFTNQNVDVLVANDYAYGGLLNPDNTENTIYYKAALSYTDTQSVEKKVTTEFSIRNEMPGIRGYLSANFKNPDTRRPFGKYSLSNDIDPYGDGQTVTGARVLMAGGGSFGDSLCKGGYQFLQKWNTDAFELTPQDFAENDKLIPNLSPFGGTGQTIISQGYWYGISQLSNPNSLNNLAQATVENYRWYTPSDLPPDLYASVGAVLMDVQTPIARTWKYGGTYLTAISEKNGSQTDQGTPNIYVAEMAIFTDEQRASFNPGSPEDSQKDASRYDITKNYSIFTETKYNDENKLLTLQEPVNGHTKFDTLGIVPIKVSNSLTADKSTYRSTETVNWTIQDNSLLASQNYHDSDEISWNVILPKGVSYVLDSGKYGGNSLVPEVTINPDGTQKLLFRVTAVSTPEVTATLKNINFDTQFDDLNINFINNTASLTAQSVISTSKDTSDEALRLATATIVVNRIGRLGLYEKLSPSKGEINQEYQLSLSPYTTSLKEPNVRGLVILPKDGDHYGSTFNGTSQLSAITTHLNDEQEVKFYLNTQPVTYENPNNINVAADGWQLYTGQSLTGTQAVLYEFQETLSPGDSAEIILTMVNRDNQPGDIYRHRTLGNSGSNYPTAISSNMVEHRIFGREISGVVWLDENQDGQIQSTEKKLAVCQLAFTKKHHPVIN
ncbi:hypothetical protein [Enterococcus sp. LJL90]